MDVCMCVYVYMYLFFLANQDFDWRNHPDIEENASMEARRRTKSEGESVHEQKQMQIMTRAAPGCPSASAALQKGNKVKADYANKNGNVQPQKGPVVRCPEYAKGHSQQNALNAVQNKAKNVVNRPNPPREHRKIIRHGNNPTKVNQNKPVRSASKEDIEKDEEKIIEDGGNLEERITISDHHRPSDEVESNGPLLDEQPHPNDNISNLNKNSMSYPCESAVEIKQES